MNIKQAEQATGPNGPDIDDYLARMEQESKAGGYFMQWLEDYKKVAAAEHDREFTFIPDDGIVGVRDFTNALMTYARENHLDLVITKESMYPEFTIDGIEYTAERIYQRTGCAGLSLPVASVHARMLHPEQYAPQDVPQARQRWQRLLHRSWPLALVLGYILIQCLSRRELFSSPDGIFLLVMLVILAVVWYGRFLLFHNNDGGTPHKK